MYSRANNKQEDKSRSVAYSKTHQQGRRESDSPFVDNRPEAIAQRKLKELTKNSPQAKQAAQFKAIANHSAGVIQRKLYFQGKWYGSGDQGKLSKLTLDDGSHLPGWSPNQLESENEFFILNENNTEWVKDQRILFTRIPTDESEDKVKVRTGAHRPEINHSDDDENRAIPKRSTFKTVSRATLIKENKGSDENNWHWTLECEVEGGKIQKSISMDLLMNEHRVFYGASEKVSKKQGAEEYNKEEYEAIPFTLTHPMPVHVVYGTMLEVVKEDGGWTDTAGYNCQNFVLAMLKKLDVVEKKDLKKQAIWREKRRKAAAKAF